MEENIRKLNIPLPKPIATFSFDKAIKTLSKLSQQINLKIIKKQLATESAILVVVAFYFVWVFANNGAFKVYGKDLTPQESEQYLSAMYTYVDVTILTGEVQKETYAQYVVAPKETISDIAKRNDLHVASILEANNIKPAEADLVKPGTKILIPSEDTTDSNDWIVASNVRIEKEKAEAEKQRLANLKKKKLALSNSRNVIARSTSGKNIGSYSGNNLYPWGYCTWYVASRRNVPRWGNAGAWLSNARASGYATGSTPRAGAIFVSNESPVGHVGIVESVNGNSIKISEMNYGGLGRYNVRTVPANSSRIRGYIY